MDETMLSAFFNLPTSLADHPAFFVLFVVLFLIF